MGLEARGPLASMPQERRLELAGNHALAHPVEQGERCTLSARPLQFGECGVQGSLGDDVGLDACRKTSAQASLWLSSAVSRFSSRIMASMSVAGCTI